MEEFKNKIIILRQQKDAAELGDISKQLFPSINYYFPTPPSQPKVSHPPMVLSTPLVSSTPIRDLTPSDEVIFIASIFFISILAASLFCLIKIKCKKTKEQYVTNNQSIEMADFAVVPTSASIPRTSTGLPTSFSQLPCDESCCNDSSHEVDVI